MFKPIRKTHPAIKIINGAVIDLPAPMNLSTLWNFGSLMGLCLIIQIITGLFLAMHYTPHISMAFSSIAHIMRDVNYGWLLRALHANSASFFFLFLYIHIGRGMYYGSYLYTETWNLGVILFIATMATAFVGYVLPWGQMSFWGATVITNLLSAIPYIGKMLVEWVWGGFAIDNATLNRFFAIHFLLPFVLAAISCLHLLCLHQTGSNNPLGLNSDTDKVPFHWYYSVKDTLGFLIMMVLLLMVSMFFPNLLTDPENFLPANPLVTPIHIKPEWYFLWAYAILRSIPNKLGGVMALFASMLVLFILPMTFMQARRSMSFYPINQILFWLLVTTCILLTWIGGCPVEAPYELIGQILTTLYFMYYILAPIMPLLWDKIISI